MSGMQDSSTTQQIECGSCGEVVDEWADVSIINVIDDDTMSLQWCIPCVDIVGLLLDIDFEESPEGMFRINEFGKIEAMKKDSN